MRTFRRVIQEKEVEARVRRNPGRPCRNDCGRSVTRGEFCRPCLLAFSEGYFLCPAAARNDPKLPGRAEKLALYAARAAARLPLFEE